MVVMRPLSKLEASAWQASPGSLYEKFEFIIEYKGELDAEALRRAFISLSDSYPVLRSTIRKWDECDTGYAWDVSDGVYPHFAIIDGGWDAMRKLSKHRKNRLEYSQAGFDHPGNRTNDLANLVLFRERHHGYILLSLSHTIFTAAQLHAYIPELCRFYTAIVAGDKVDINTHPFPISGNELQSRYRANFREGNHADSKEKSKQKGPIRGNRSTCNERQTWGCERIIELNKDATERMIAGARKNMVKVPSVIGSAMALAIKTSKSFKDLDPIIIGATVDMSRRIGLESTETFVSGTHHSMELTIPSNTEMVTIARTLQDKIENLEQEIPQDKIAPDIMLNNAGVFPPFSHPEQLQWTDFIIENWIRKCDNWDDFDDAQLNVLNNNKSARPCSLVFHTNNGKLRILCQLRGDLDADIADVFSLQLQEFVGIVDPFRIVHLDHGDSW